MASVTVTAPTCLNLISWLHSSQIYTMLFFIYSFIQIPSIEWSDQRRCPLWKSLISHWHMEDLLDFDDAAVYPFGLSNNSVCAATSINCLENNHSVQSIVKASACRSLTLPASPSPHPPAPLCSSPICNALWDWITKSHMQLMVLSGATV